MKSPLVSILTPSFNQGGWLPDNIQSVLSQSYCNIEHIVVDGGSDDKSANILENISDSRLKWVSEPDNGQSDAINKAFALSKGEIIGWLNSDDAFFDVKAVESVVDYFASHDEVDVVYGHAAHTDSDGRLVGIMWVPQFTYVRLKWHCFIVQPSVFIRRKALTQPLVDESFGFAMDWELWLRLGVNHRFARIDRILSIDRDHPHRKTRHAAANMYLEDEARLRDRYGVGPPPLTLRWLIGRAFAAQRRLMGAMKIGEVARARLAFNGCVDLRPLLLRQLLVPRSWWHR